jgi:hypothetical protein
MKTRITMLIVLGAAGLALSLPALARREGAAVPRGPASSARSGGFAREGAHAREPVVFDEVRTSAMQASASAAKAATDTTTLMGPAGLYPFRGDFETASALPGGNGQLADGWTSVDETAPQNHWHVSSFNNPGSGNGAWCGDTYPACEAGDPEGGYGNDWFDILEFRRAVADPNVATDVRVQGVLRYDSEPYYDYVFLARRTNDDPDFEPITSPGQGLSWDGAGTVTVDYTFHFAPDEYLGGEIRLAFLFDSDPFLSDGDCGIASAGAAVVDNLVVTCSGGLAATFAEDFEDGVIGPDWGLTMPQGTGDFARVWAGLCIDDPCHGNNSRQVAFINTYPELNPAPWPPAGCGAVDTHGGFLDDYVNLENAVVSPVMPLPTGADGLTLAFDVYQDELLTLPESAGMCWAWGVRSAADPDDVRLALWQDRGFLYIGGPEYKRVELKVGDLLVPGATAAQVRLELVQIGLNQYPPGHRQSPAPYFDNVRVSAYHDLSAGPALTTSEGYLANDAFPASGTLDLANLGANSVRFDMARNISARSHLRNDPGDSIWVDVVTRSGATLTAPPVMYWTLARRNALFDPYRVLPANPVNGVRARLIGFPTVANRWRFDLPDTGMLFPGDVVQYYFSATDTRGGDTRTSTLPADLTGFGNPDPLIWSNRYTMRCLPSLGDANGVQPHVLIWNDQGTDTGEDEWYNALRHDFVALGVDYDLYTTHAASSGAGNGLGGRATVAQLAGYSDILYTCGSLSNLTLSNGDYSYADAGNDLALMNGWLAAGGRDLLLAGNHLAKSLQAAGSAGTAFLANTMGLQFRDDDVSNDLDGQLSPRAVSVALNPVLRGDLSWLAFGGCPGRARFDRVEPLAGVQVLARYLAPDGVSTPYASVPALLNLPAGNRVVTLAQDLAWLRDPAKAPAPQASRTQLLADVLAYFDIAGNPGQPMADVPAAAAALAVTAHPNPFNPAVTLRYALPAPGRVTMKVFDARGALVRTLLDEDVKTAGGKVTWDGADDRGAPAASGPYFVQTRAGGQVDVRKVTMLK